MQYTVFDTPILRPLLALVARVGLRLSGWRVEGQFPADSRYVLAEGEKVLALQQQTGKVAMCGHTRRFNPSHQYVHQKVTAGEFNIQQMDVQTYFFRRTNMNALGQPRSWTDHLLWHHAAHTVDLFAYQAGSPIVQANALQGPIHPTLGIAMDMSIQLKAANGAICTLSLSFNNDGPLGTFFRYIGDSGLLLRGALLASIIGTGRPCWAHHWWGSMPSTLTRAVPLSA